ncbi:hypothetical protein X011_04870 [Mycobacterium tuberculosis variant microti OV254]|nr:hypothetical protein X011_04870 [Mycobacterium tuberculosis variant microti OV254]
MAVAAFLVTVMLCAPRFAERVVTHSVWAQLAD